MTQEELQCENLTNGVQATTFANAFDLTFSRNIETIEQKVKKVTDRFTGFTFASGDWNEIDAILDIASLPAIVMLFPESGSLKESAGQWYDEERIMLGFFDRVGRDANCTDNLATYNAMKAVGLMFISELNKGGDFNYINAANYTPFTEQMSSIVTGLLFDLTLKETQGQCAPSLCAQTL